MNSERRHELQENWLAGALVKANKAIDPYSKPIAGGVAVAFAAMIGWGIYSSQQSDSRSDATLQLIEASVSGDAESLDAIAAQYPGTSAAAWSMLYQGGQKMAAGFTALFNSRAEAEELLDEASRSYTDALAASDDPIIQSRAHFGLARVAESLGNVDEATSHYESAMMAGESEAMATEAKDRIARLSNPQTQAFLEWFGKQDFAPADPSLPPSLPGLGELPDLPNLEIPDVEPTEGDDNADEESGPTGGLEMPATDEASEPAGETTAEEPVDATDDKEPTSAAEERADEETTAESPAAEAPASVEPATEAAGDAEPTTESN